MPQAIAVDRVRKDCRRCRTVTGDISGLLCDLMHHLGAHVFEWFGEFDLLGDRDTVLRY